VVFVVVVDIAVVVFVTVVTVVVPFVVVMVSVEAHSGSEALQVGSFGAVVVDLVLD